MVIVVEHSFSHFLWSTYIHFLLLQNSPTLPHHQLVNTDFIKAMLQLLFYVALVDLQH